LLTQSSAIRKEKAFVAEGVRLVEEGIKENYPSQFILYSDQLSERGMVLIRSLPSSCETYQVDADLLNKLSGTETSQGILAVFDLKTIPLPPDPDFLVIADGIRDPGNLGTLLRTSEAAGVQGVLLSPGTTQAFAPKVLRAAMGAHFRLPIQTCSWDEIANFCSGVTIFNADMQGEVPYWQADFKQPLAVLIGSEAEGSGEQALKLSTQSVNIPMPGRSESLNAGMAGAILIFEVVRQRNS
jgi:TrmH family RNA methyltransferase